MIRIFVFSLFLTLCAQAENAKAEFVRFSIVSDGIYRGSMPENPADMDELQKLGIRTIVSLKTSEEATEEESEWAQARGMSLIHTPLIAWIFPPKEANVNLALTALKDPSLRPVFVHCTHGRDRTGLVVALHRMHHEGWSPDQAYEEWRSHGFEDPWFMSGLSEYFWSHLPATEQDTSLLLGR